MADIRPFRAVRPAKELAEQVAALPYDVYSREEAAAAVIGRPYSFLNIDRPETMFPPKQDMYAPEVYEAARQRYEDQKTEGVYRMDGQPCYYIYELTMDGRRQTGIVAVCAVNDYLNGVCKKHENTVEAKEQDRIRHVDTLSAQTGPIFLSYHKNEVISDIISTWKEKEPEFDFISEDGIGHRGWKIDEEETICRIREAFGSVEATYIADGHHRAASAVNVSLKRRAAATSGSESGLEFESESHEAGYHEYDYFLSVLFPDEELKILDYNRVVKDLNGLTEDAFLEGLEKSFEIRMTSLNCRDRDAEILLRPETKGEIGMYLGGRSYRLTVRKEVLDEVGEDPVESLDVDILQERVLSPLLGIGDPRTDPRIRFVGGIRGLGELVTDADGYSSEKGPAVAFAMYPTSIQELFRVADAGLLMPPKSTWFEPKLRSGLFIHEIER